MSSKLSRFLGSPFRLRGGEVLVELVILPHHLASGVPQVMMQAPGHKYPAAEEQNGQSKKHYSFVVKFSRSVLCEERDLGKRLLRWTLEAQVLLSSQRLPELRNHRAAYSQDFTGCRWTLRKEPTAEGRVPTARWLYTQYHLRTRRAGGLPARCLCNNVNCTYILVSQAQSLPKWIDHCQRPCLSSCCHIPVLSSWDITSAGHPAAHESWPCVLGEQRW